MEKCKNCGNPVQQKYCGVCGQLGKLERITFSFIWHEVFHFFTHINKGFPFTTLQMLRSPGQTVLDYLEGKRKQHQSPVSYFLIWTTVFVITLYLFVKIFGPQAVIEYQNYFGPGASTTFAISNLSFMLAFIIPIQALYLYGLITRNKYNYVETLVMLIYAVGTIIFLQFVFACVALVQYLITGRALTLQYSDILKAGFFIWMTYSLLRVYPVSHKVIRGILFLVFTSATFMLWRLVVVPGIASLFVK